ncbi:MAG: PilZ domain-containing protein [Spirochaetales bacterium]|nr:PilZ domain-containing protein [Spirochaetales bacterium]
MGSEIKRIEKEFILKNLHEKRAPLEIHLSEERLQAFIDRFDEERLVLVLPDDILPAGLTELTVFFRFRNNPMTFTSKVLEAQEGRIEVALPEELFRDLSRSFERISSPKGVSVAFLFKGKQVRLDYPDSDQYDPVEEPELEAGFDATRIADLLKAFRERAGRFASENKIVMLRERTPTSFQEKLVAKTGKIVALPFYAAEAQIRSAEVRERILSQDEIIAHEAEEGEDMFMVLERIGKIIDANREKRIWHELYCPILYHQYVVGYLYLMRANSEQEKFEPATFDFVLQYSRILAYSLKANGYFRAAPVIDEFGAAELIDISGSGLLFSYPPDGPEILLYTDLDLRISVGGQTIPVRGRVMRSYNDADRVYIAIQFIELDPDDMEILFEHIYGRQYRGDVDSVGVADPANMPIDEL